MQLPTTVDQPLWSLAYPAGQARRTSVCISPFWHWNEWIKFRVSDGSQLYNLVFRPESKTVMVLPNAPEAAALGPGCAALGIARGVFYSWQDGSVQELQCTTFRGAIESNASAAECSEEVLLHCSPLTDPITDHDIYFDEHSCRLTASTLDAEYVVLDFV